MESSGCDQEVDLNMKFLIQICLQTILKFEAAHLYLSQCLTPKLLEWLDLFRERYQDEEIVLQFRGSQTLTIDADLKKEIFHGVNIYIESKIIYIGENKDDHPIYEINVSGLDGQPHTEKKARKPTATGCEGNDGEPGRVGESAGHVIIISKENIMAYEKLEIICDGGNGGDGQDAGDGTDGANGKRGRDGDRPENPPSSGKCQVYEATKGGNGENGGNSGKIGKGGEGGCRGSYEIFQGKERFCKEGDVSFQAIIVHILCISAIYMMQFNTRTGQKVMMENLVKPVLVGKGGFME